MSAEIFELPQNYLKNLSRKEKKDIANEIFLAEKFCKLRYKYNWNNEEDIKEKGLRSKRSLLYWLHGRNEDAIDFVTIYCEENENHFDEEGNWQGRYLLEALSDISRKFLDPEYITNPEKLKEFESSAKDEQWRENAVLVIGDYLARSLYDMSALKSKYLAETVAIKKSGRKYLDELNKIKNSNNDTDNKDDSNDANKIEEEGNIIEIDIDEIIEGLEETIKCEAEIEAKNKYNHEINFYEQRINEIEDNYREELPYIFTDQMSFNCDQLGVQ